MTGTNKQNGGTEPEDGAEATLPAGDELEAALREATESVEARRADRDAAEGDEIEVDLEAAASTSQDPDASVPNPGPVADLEAQLEESQQKHLRLAADFDNFRKRTLKDRDEAHKFGHQNLVKDLLPSVDNLERAIAHAQKSEEGDIEGLLEGVELVSRELAATLEKHGVTPIDPDGEPFDPALHEAMAQAPDASVPPNTVVEVFQRGYVLRTRLLRPARVVVSKTPEEEGSEGSGERET